MSLQLHGGGAPATGLVSGANALATDLSRCPAAIPALVRGEPEGEQQTAATWLTRRHHSSHFDRQLFMAPDPFPLPTAKDMRDVFREGSVFHGGLLDRLCGCSGQVATPDSSRPMIVAPATRVHRAAAASIHSSRTPLPPQYTPRVRRCRLVPVVGVPSVLVDGNLVRAKLLAAMADPPDNNQSDSQFFRTLRFGYREIDARVEGQGGGGGGVLPPPRTTSSVKWLSARQPAPV